MTDSKGPARPPQVTMAGWVTVVASAFLLVTIFTFVSNLRSIETREGVQEALGREPLKGTGLDLEQALSLMHVSAMVAGACAAATAILGWFALQRNHHARIALSIIVVPLFLTGLVAGGFLASMVAVSVVLLWGRPARDWFNGIAPQPQQRQQLRRPQDPPDQPPQPPVSQEPRSFEGFGTKPTGGSAPDSPPVTPPPTAPASPYGHRPQVTQHHGGPVVRPREVIQACVFTWVVCGVVFLGMVVALIGFAAYPDLVQDVYESDSRFAEADVSVDALRAASIFIAAVFTLWSVVAMVLAWFVFQGHNWARITLIVSASMAAMLSLLMVISSPPLILVTVTAVLTIVALTRRPAVEWFSAGSHRH